MTRKIEKIIVRYLDGSGTADDMKLLSEWIKTPANRKKFEVFAEDHYAILYSISAPDTDQAEYRLLSAIKSRKSARYRTRLRRMVYGAAAVLAIGLLAGTYMFSSRVPGNHTPEPAAHSIVTGTQKAILTLDDGSEIALGKGKILHTENFMSDDAGIAYPGNGKDRTASDGISYNYLTVPKGGQFRIILSDGTRVWLNSDSRLKYPVAFEQGALRQVELLYGEAYFDVSPATGHLGMGFHVLHNEQEVQVLGTEFNIKAYKDEDNIYTTLVEGKVTVQCPDGKQSLLPGRQTVYSPNDRSLLVKTVNTFNETSWKEGILSFDGKSLGEIMKVLSRWYDFRVEFLNSTVRSEEFIGVLDKNQDIEEILSQIRNSGVINDYEIINRKIILK